MTIINFAATFHAVWNELQPLSQPKTRPIGDELRAIHARALAVYEVFGPSDDQLVISTYGVTRALTRPHLYKSSLRRFQAPRFLLHDR